MTCPLCESANHFELQRTAPLSSEEEMVKLSLAEAGRPIVFNACCHCGLIFRSPRPEFERLAKHYAHALPMLESDIKQQLGVTGERAAERETYRFEETYHQVQRYNRRDGGHIIDIGGGAGRSLLPWLKSGWQATLVDAGVKSRPAINPLIQEVSSIQKALSLPESKFDVITSFHCIEHLLSIKDSLKEMSRLSAPSTLWVIEVPFDVLYIRGLLGSAPIAQSQINIEHLNFFTPQSLSFVARLLNLRVLALQSIVVLYWFGPTVSIRLYACDEGHSENERPFADRFKSPQAFRRFLTYRLPLWRRWAGLKFRYYRYRTTLA